MPDPLTLTPEVVDKISRAVIVSAEYGGEDADYLVLTLDDPRSGERFTLYADAPSLYPKTV